MMEVREVLRRIVAGQGLRDIARKRARSKDGSTVRGGRESVELTTETL